jgi:hypothetical protein
MQRQPSNGAKSAMRRRPCSRDWFVRRPSSSNSGGIQIDHSGNPEHRQSDSYFIALGPRSSLLQDSHPSPALPLNTSVPT